MDPKPILDQQRAERAHYGKALMQALRDAMPWGLEVDLGNDAKAVLMHMNGVPSASQPKRLPIYPDGTPPHDDGTKPIGFEEWSFTFDFKLENCDQDHIEITARISGGGGLV